MSRIGRKPILIPEGVEVRIEGNKVIVKGKNGELFHEFRPELSVEAKDKNLLVTERIKTKQSNALWGLTRNILKNMVEGVTKEFEKKLEIQGIGYRAALEGNDLALYVGYSHKVLIKSKAQIKFSVEKNIITVSGPDKYLVGQVAAKIKKVRVPDSYKGKGIRYLGEIVRKKEGKKAATAAAPGK